ncbi:hypothetical protein [Paenibacillus sp. Root444D2]|uniref:hypothetical protein n=1 Tax=Paenibacillus sp. Root444D2 TaxID=1736538 RepID=UPI0007102E5B|nr:hypothetical protein [Paenibacillus sp. Root444D2]KQX56610.1 hypothetical protein ASD40_04210 [Paenibacillus sp. Root444D2]
MRRREIVPPLVNPCSIANHIVIDTVFQGELVLFAWSHIGGFHGILKRELCDFIVDELYRFVKGEDLLGRVTLDQYGRLTPW